MTSACKLLSLRDYVMYGRSLGFLFFNFFNLFLIRGKLLYNVVLVSATRQCKSAIIKHIVTAAKSLQSCLTLCDPIDSSPPGSPILGILQARILEWVAISFSHA